jgi:hypothetical protein
MTADRIRAFAGLLLPPVAWYVFEQGLSYTLRGSCTAAGIPAGPVWGVFSLAACALAGWLALTVARAEDGTDAFIARLALLGAGLFALAIAYQTLATLIVPPCAH